MPFKIRTESRELKTLSYLNNRMELPPSEKKRYLKLEKGYEGELKFDQLTANLDNKFYVLNDLNFKLNKSKFQIDTLILTRDLIFLCEVKNYIGDYLYQEENFIFCHNKEEITNPLHQINRSKNLLRQLLQQHNFHIPIQEQLIFINPNFFLYQAPLKKPITYYPHLEQFLKTVSTKPSNLNDWHHKLAELLVKEHIQNPDYEIPEYKYDDLRKGNTCGICDSFNLSLIGNNIVCNTCSHQESVEASVLRIVEEFRLLFPDRKVTTSIIHEWCKIINSKWIIRKILIRNYLSKGYGKWAYYE